MGTERGARPAMRQGQPDVEAEFVCPVAARREQDRDHRLAGGRFLPQEIEDGIRRAVADPAGGECRGQRRGHDIAGPHRTRKGPEGAAVFGRNDIGETQTRADAFRQPADMPGKIGRNGGERCGTVQREKTIGIIFDDRHAVFLRDGGDFRPPRCRHGEGQRILQRRIEI